MLPTTDNFLGAEVMDILDGLSCGEGPELWQELTGELAGNSERSVGLAQNTGVIPEGLGGDGKLRLSGSH